MGKNQSASNITNIIKQDASGNIAFMSGSTMLMSLSTTGQMSGSSPVLAASTASFVATAQTASFVVIAQTSSFVANAQTASFVANAQSASNAVSAQTASYANTFTVGSTLTAQTLVVQTITSSVNFVTGSTRFGSISANTHQFTGSMSVSGSINVTNGITVPSNGIISIANGSTLAGNDVVAIGTYPVATGANSIAIGYNPRTQHPTTSATASSAIAIGYNPYAGGNQSISIGFNTKTFFNDSLNIKDAIFATGSNVWVTGSMGIGTSNPNHRLDVNGDINIPGTNKIVFNNEPNSWFLQARTTTSTANLGSGLKNLFYNGGGTSEGIAFSGVGTGAASMEIRNDGRVWVKENLNVGGTITESSSIRYKTNIETVKYGLDKVLQLRGVTYDKKDTGIRELGLIAEEVNEILPDVVIKNEEGEPDSVSYGRLTAVLIEAVKDLQAQINELKVK
jgi:hypothetical protein